MRPSQPWPFFVSQHQCQKNDQNSVSYHLHVKQQKLSRQQDDGLFTVTVHALVPKLYALGRVVLLTSAPPSQSQIRLFCPLG